MDYSSISQTLMCYSSYELSVPGKIIKQFFLKWMKRRHVSNTEQHPLYEYTGVHTGNHAKPAKPATCD